MPFFMRLTMIMARRPRAANTVKYISVPSGRKGHAVFMVAE